MQRRISLAVSSSATRVCTMLSFQELTFWESHHHIPHPGALSPEVNKVPFGSISCTISDKPQARICSGCSRHIGVVGNFSEWDAINTEYSLSPSANSDDLLENEFSRTIIWKRAGLRPVLSPKEILIWTFYTEFSRPESSTLLDPNFPRAISAQFRASPARHPGPPLERARSSLPEVCRQGLNDHWAAQFSYDGEMNFSLFLKNLSTLKFYASKRNGEENHKYSL